MFSNFYINAGIFSLILGAIQGSILCFMSLNKNLCGRAYFKFIFLTSFIPLPLFMILITQGSFFNSVIGAFSLICLPAICLIATTLIRLSILRSTNQIKSQDVSITLLVISDVILSIIPIMLWLTGLNNSHVMSSR